MILQRPLPVIKSFFPGLNIFSKTVTLIGYDNEKSNTTFDIVIHEGRNRQVRRMCDFIGFPVRQLKRIKLGNLTLQGLKRGGYRILNEDEINALIKAAAINE